MQASIAVMNWAAWENEGLMFTCGLFCNGSFVIEQESCFQLDDSLVKGGIAGERI